MLTGAWLGFLDSGSNETDKTAPGDDHGRLVDADGKNVFGCAYRAQHLAGAGTIGPRGQMHSPNQDVKALCSKFGIEAPEEHRAYWSLRPANRGVA